MKPETRFKAKVVKMLQEIGCWHVKTQQVAVRGTPDILGCRNGKFFALELKADKESKTSALQEFELSCIASNNGIALVVYPENLQESLEIVRGL